MIMLIFYADVCCMARNATYLILFCLSCFGAGIAAQVTLFVNASTCTEQYNPTHRPIVFDLPTAPELREATKLAARDRMVR